VSQTTATADIEQRNLAETGTVVILLAAAFSHLLNDMMQSLLPSLYPILKANFSLSFGQIGLITLIWNVTASLLQPVIGTFTDRKPQAYALPVGMGLTLAGLLLLAFAGNFLVLLLAAAFIGMGSAVFHPEAARIARLASGGRHGFAQSLFQVGGAVGSAVGPLLAAAIVLPHGQTSVAWFSAVALIGMIVLANVGAWYKRHSARRAAARGAHLDAAPEVSPARIRLAIAALLLLTFSKYFYLSSLTSYYTFYLIHRFGVSVQTAQVYLFVFLAASAAGTLIGGPIGDRVGRKIVIWWSILGVLPFTLVLPYVDLTWTVALSVVIGLVLSSAFSAIVVFGQELVPGKVGMINGLFFGFAFGMAGIGAAVLGELADLTDITFVYQVCAFLPLLGLFTIFLPNLGPRRSARH
jgi:MFS transporter, FSR family, fosmidomycin resistance protein